jgi:hypothetical protein
MEQLPVSSIVILERMQLSLFAPLGGTVGNLVVGVLFLLFGLIGFYDAYKGIWIPGHFSYQKKDSVAAPWYLRAFLLLAGLCAIWMSWVFLRR